MELQGQSVLVIGAGVLGAAAASHVARAGAGRVGIVDPEPGLADLAARALGGANPELLAEPYPALLEEANAQAMIAGSDAVVDCSNDLDTHRVAAGACSAAGIPLVVAGATRAAWLTVILPGGSWESAERSLPAGGSEAAPDALKSAAGALAALETQKVLTGAGDLLAGRVLVLDGLAGHVTEAVA